MEHFARLERVRKPVIVCIHGFAVGGGLEVALCADIRIATEDALLGTPEARTNGGMPGIAFHRLARLIPHGEAMKIMLTSQPLSGRRAYDIGLVQDVARDEDEMMQIAARYVGEVSECNRSSITTIKRIARWSYLDDVASSIRFGEHTQTTDQPERPSNAGAAHLAQRRAERAADR